MFHAEWDGRDATEGLVRSLMVVAVHPVQGHGAHLIQGIEDIAVQHLGAVGSVEVTCPIFSDHWDVDFGLV